MARFACSTASKHSKTEGPSTGRKSSSGCSKRTAEIGAPAPAAPASASGWESDPQSIVAHCSHKFGFVSARLVKTWPQHRQTLVSMSLPILVAFIIPPFLDCNPDSKPTRLSGKRFSQFFQPRTGRKKAAELVLQAQTRQSNRARRSHRIELVWMTKTPFPSRHVSAHVWQTGFGHRPGQCRAIDWAKFYPDGQPTSGRGRAASISSSRLYLLRRSDWVIDPILI